MTKKVVDLNYLQSPDLARFLRTHPGNRVVLTDYLAMESYNSNDLNQSTGQYLKYLAPFAKQALVLKGTRQVVNLSFKRKGMQKRLVDVYETKRFEDFCLAIGKVADGDQSYDHSLAQAREAAKDHLDRALLPDPQKITNAMAAFRQEWTQDELKELRTQSISRSLLEKLSKHVLGLSALLIADHVDKPVFPQHFSEVVNTFAFRLALAFYAQLLLRLSTGADAIVNPPKYRNDMVDCTYVAYATFFDGLLTNDRKLRDVHRHTNAVLSVLIRE